MRLLSPCNIWRNKLHVIVSKERSLNRENLRMCGKYEYQGSHDYWQGIISDNTLCNVECTALLDLEIDSKLSFNAHVGKICKKLASRITLLRKIIAFLPLIQRVKWAIYASFIWSRSSSIASLNCKTRQESFFMRIARRLLLPSLKSSLGSRFMSNQGLISALLFRSVLMGLCLIT